MHVSNYGNFEEYKHMYNAPNKEMDIHILPIFGIKRKSIVHIIIISEDS